MLTAQTVRKDEKGSEKMQRPKGSLLLVARENSLALKRNHTIAFA
jgi:hypothetical protein